MIIPLLTLLMVVMAVAWAAYALPVGIFTLLMLSVSPLLVTYAVFATKMFRARAGVRNAVSSYGILSLNCPCPLSDSMMMGVSPGGLSSA